MIVNVRSSDGGHELGLLVAPQNGSTFCKITVVDYRALLVVEFPPGDVVA